VAIPTSQPKVWSTRPDPGGSGANTFDSIKNALAAWGSLQSYEYRIYLQGFYANATNIRATAMLMLWWSLLLSLSDLSALTLQSFAVLGALLWGLERRRMQANELFAQGKSKAEVAGELGVSA
jgi:hypothetical protein